MTDGGLDTAGSGRDGERAEPGQDTEKAGPGRSAAEAETGQDAAEAGTGQGAGAAEDAPVRLVDLGASAAYAVRLAWRADRRVLGQVVGIQVIIAAGLGVVILVLRQVFGDVLDAGMGAGGDGMSMGRLVPAVGGMLLAGSVGGVLQTLSAARERLLEVKVDRYVIDRVLGEAAARELPDFEDPAFHDRLQRAVFASRSQPALVVTMMVSLLQTALTIGAVTAVFLVMAWWLLPFALLSAIPAIRAGRADRHDRYDLHRSLAENRRLREYVERLLTDRNEAKEIRALNLGPVLRARWNRQYAREVDGVIGVLRAHLRRMIRARLAGDVLIALVLVGVWWLVRVDAVSLPAAGAGLVGLWLLATNVRTLSGMLNNVGESILYLRDLRTFTVGRHASTVGGRASATDAAPAPAPAVPGPATAPSTGPEAAAPAGPRASAPTSPAATACTPPSPTHPPFRELRAERVDFTYPGSERPVLRDVSVRLGEGEVVALVGANGSGKTTLSKVLAGLYRPSAGAVLRDGVPVTDVVGQRALAGVLFQDYARFRLSAADNIAFGRAHAPVDEGLIRTAAARAGAAEFVERLPAGYDTPLGKEFSGGADLSGGQWQRLALARAFYRDAPLVILDEPTASLDPQAEARLFARIRELFHGRTVLLISHRFASVRHADRIYLLQDGRVTEEGTHASLLREDGVYARLFRLQADSYLPVPDGGAERASPRPATRPSR